MSTFDKLLLEACGWNWENLVKKSLLKRGLLRKLIDWMVFIEESASYTGYCTQLRGVNDRLGEVERYKKSFRLINISIN